MPEHPPQSKQFTAIIEREDDGYVALCPELDVASQGDTIEEARRNLLEARESDWQRGRGCAPGADGHPRVGVRREPSPVEQLALERGEEAIAEGSGS